MAFPTNGIQGSSGTSQLQLMGLPSSSGANHHPLLSLPIDLIYTTLLSLGIEDIVACGLVCRDLKQITQSEDLWKRLFMRDLQPYASAQDCCSGFYNAFKNCWPISQNLLTGVYASHPVEFQDICSCIVADNKIFSALSGQLGIISIRDLETFESLGSIFGGNWTRSLAFANGTLFTGLIDGPIKMWNVDTEEPFGALFGHATKVRSLVVVDGRLISDDSEITGSIKIWDLEKMECLHTFEGSSFIVTNGKLCSISQNTVTIRDVETGECIHTLEHAYFLRTLVAKDNELITGSSDGTIAVWDLATGKRLNVFDGHVNSVDRLIVTEGKIISGSSFEPFIRIWDLKTGKLLNEIQATSIDARYYQGVYSLLIADQMLFATLSDNTIKVWDLETLDCLSIAGMNYEGGFVVVNAYAKGKLFSKHADGSNKIWDYRAKHAVVFAEIARLFKSGSPKGVEEAMDRFSRMPKKARDKIYGELYHILKPFTNDYVGCGEHAFHDLHGLNSTPQQKAQAIENYLAKESSKAS